METLDTKWFALQVQPLKERVVATILANKGYELFLPLWKPQTKAGPKSPVCVLFPGYLFCRFDPNVCKAPVVTTPGFVRIVGFGRSPEPVQDWELENLRKVTVTKSIWRTEHELQQGARVRVSKGPFTGVEGILAKRHGQDRVVVQISILGGGASIDVDHSSVEPLDAIVETPPVCEVSAFQPIYS